MEEYNKAYKQLNAEQKRAVDHIEGPVLVVAGPGTGKTQLLGVRVARILETTDTDASSILCVTFTNKAAMNMRERLNQLIGPESRHVVVRTFHSFAADIMNEYPDYFWSGARLSVAPDAVQDDIIQSILATLPLDNPLSSTFAGSYTALGDVKQSLKLAKEAGLTPEELRTVITENLEYIEKLELIMVELLSPTLSVKKLEALQTAVSKLPDQPDNHSDLLLPLSSVIKDSLAQAVAIDMESGKTTETGKWKKGWVQTVNGTKGMYSERKRNEWWLLVADVYEAYRDQLHARGYYDYSDMLVEVLEQLQKQPEMLADVQERYLYVLIDEFQDTNAAQLRLAHLIADHFSAHGRPNLMAVGDDDQSIFAFNGAELNNVLGFRRSYPDTKVIVLKGNYRSSQKILDISEQIIEQAEDRLVKREPDLTKNLVAQSEPKKPTAAKHLSFPTQHHQFSALARTIKDLWDDNEQDIAVLARQHSSLKQLASLLLKQGIPVRYDQQSNILEHEAVKQICHIARTAVAIATGDKNSVNVEISQLVRHPMWHLSALQLWKLATANYSSPDWLNSLLDSDDEQLQKIGHWLAWLGRNSNDQPLALTIEYILGLREGQYLTSPFREYYINKKPVSSEYLETLSAINVLRNLVEEFGSSETTLHDFMRFIELNLNTNRVIADESWFTSGKQAVQLLTVYKAKGLEFDHVYVVDATEDMWKPKRRGRASPANLRLQAYGEKYDDYIRLLYVAASRAKRMFTATSYFTDSVGNELLQTPLLSAIPTTVVSEPIDEPVPVLEQGLAWPRLSTTDEKALLGSRLEEYVLSPTAFIDFLNIAEAGPQNFMERHILRIPTLGSVAGSYGNAIHAALETAQRLVNNSSLEFGTVLDRFEATLESEHLLPTDRKRLQAKGQKLLSDLLEHGGLALSKGSLAEQRIADIFVGEARIKGKLDLITAKNEQLIISDYKTGKALPSFDTKNQSLLIKTWRHKTQLLFYALLASESSRYKSKDISAQMIYLEADNPKQRILTMNPTKNELDELKVVIKAVWQHIMNLDFPDVSAYPEDYKGVELFIEDLRAGKV